MTSEPVKACLGQAHRMLHNQQTYQPEEWALMAYLLEEAEAGLREMRRDNPTARLPFPDAVIDDFREAGADWERPSLARPSRAARRQLRALLALIDRD